MIGSGAGMVSLRTDARFYADERNVRQLPLQHFCGCVPVNAPAGCQKNVT
jgi:hypothetical protein